MPYAIAYLDLCSRNPWCKDYLSFILITLRIKSKKGAVCVYPILPYQHTFQRYNNGGCRPYGPPSSLNCGLPFLIILSLPQRVP